MLFVAPILFVFLVPPSCSSPAPQLPTIPTTRTLFTVPFQLPGFGCKVAGFLSDNTTEQHHAIVTCKCIASGPAFGAGGGCLAFATVGAWFGGVTALPACVFGATLGAIGGTVTQAVRCNNVHFDGGWGHWQPWTSCQGGKRYRTRGCQNGGMDCTDKFPVQSSETSSCESSDTVQLPMLGSRPLSSHFPIDSCPPDYIFHYGDVPGWGSISGQSMFKDQSIFDCKGLCGSKTECCSFEWSEASMLCNLNKECKPSGKRYHDYVYCEKK